MEPTIVFQRYATTMAVLEGQRVCFAQPEIIERRLWAAAVYDWFGQSGELVRMTDALDLPLAQARAYEIVIQSAVDLYTRSCKVISIF